MAHRSCPDCGTQILLSSAFCKCCGCRIANAMVVCSNCTALIPTYSKACPHCTTALSQESYDVEAFEDRISAELGAEQPPVVDSSAKRQWRFVAYAAMFVLIIAMGGYTFWEFRKNTDEAHDYTAAIESRDLTLCERFVAKYPESYRSEEIHALMIELKEEAKSWNATKKADNLAAYQAYLKTYPKANNAQVCQEAIDSIQWHIGSFQLIRKDLEQYISSMSNPRYKQWAKDVLSRYTTEEVTRTETEEINTTLSNFFSSLTKETMLKSPACYIHPPLYRFFGSQEAGLEQVVDHLRTLKKEQTTFSYKTLLKVRKDQLENDGMRYVASCEVDKFTQGYRKSVTMVVHLTPHYKIKSISSLKGNAIERGVTEEVSQDAELESLSFPTDEVNN